MTFVRAAAARKPRTVAGAKQSITVTAYDTGIVHYQVSKTATGTGTMRVSGTSHKGRARSQKSLSGELSEGRFCGRRSAQMETRQTYRQGRNAKARKLGTCGQA